MNVTTTTRKTPLTQAPKTMDTLLTPDEAARALDVTPGTLQVWRTTKRYPLKYVKIGKNVRYRLSDIAEFVESRVIA